MSVFRKLRADEIQVRVSQVTKEKTYLLLYKNARVDMDMLDEFAKPQNWACDYKEIKGNMYCGIGIRTSQGEWVWKWDVGVESNTEKEKGEASDSFKRACVNWGIGRELYTAPFIWIQGGDPKKDKWDVQEITYNENIIHQCH